MKMILMTFALLISTNVIAATFTCGVRFKESGSDNSSAFTPIGAVKDVYSNIQSTQGNFHVTITKMSESALAISIMDELTGNLFNSHLLESSDDMPTIFVGASGKGSRLISIWCDPK